MVCFTFYGKYLSSVKIICNYLLRALGFFLQIRQKIHKIKYLLLFGKKRLNIGFLAFCWGFTTLGA